MDDLEPLLWSAWNTLEPLLRANPDELKARLARRRSPMFLRPMRAYCLAVRASDIRITPATCACIPEDAAYPASARTDHSAAHYAPHTVTLTAPFLRRICAPVEIQPPGIPVYMLAQLLGCSIHSLRPLRHNGTLRVDYTKGFLGRRGPATPCVYTRHPLDPAAQSHQRADPIWGCCWRMLAHRLPDDFAYTLTRLPYRLARPTSRPTRPPRARPLIPPDYVWYKWKNGQFHDPHAKSPRQLGQKLKTTQRLALRVYKRNNVPNRAALLAAHLPPPA